MHIYHMIHYKHVNSILVQIRLHFENFSFLWQTEQLIIIIISIIIVVIMIIVVVIIMMMIIIIAISSTLTVSQMASSNH